MLFLQDRLFWIYFLVVVIPLGVLVGALSGFVMRKLLHLPKKLIGWDILVGLVGFCLGEVISVLSSLIWLDNGTAFALHFLIAIYMAFVFVLLFRIIIKRAKKEIPLSAAN